MKIRALWLVALFPSIAAADERGAFVSLDRQGTGSAVGVDVAAHFVTEDAGPDVAMRETVFARYVHESGLGGYGQLSLAHVFGGGDSDSAVGGAEVGALYALRAGGSDVILRLGVGLPTASSSFAGVVANNLASVSRLHDVALITPDTTWLRPGVAVRLGGPRLFAQLDAGVDIPVASADDLEAEALFHVNAGVGTRRGPLALTAEVASYAFESDEFHALHSATASVRWARPDIQPFLAYTLTFSFEDDVDAAHSVIAGAQAAF
jgi:hypothetical protein